jgi:hypothetical protein
MNDQTASAREDEYLPELSVPGRSYEDDVRICYHEASHATVQRLLSAKPIGGVSVQAGPDFDGLCWSPGHDKERSLAFGSSDARNDAILSVIASTMPRKGEVALEACRNVYAGVFEHTIEAVAGVEGERLFMPGPPSEQDGDMRLARGLASLICSPGSITAFIAFCRAEATDLLKQNEYVVLAIAEELRIKRELDGKQVDGTIAQAVANKSLADEHARRTEWQRITASASSVPIRLTAECCPFNLT